MDGLIDFIFIWGNGKAYGRFTMPVFGIFSVNKIYFLVTWLYIGNKTFSGIVAKPRK